MQLLTRVPWIVWAAILPAVIIVGMDVLGPQGQRVVVAGAGPVALLREQDAEEGRYHYDLDDVGDGSHAEVAQRIEGAIGLWPPVLVLSLDLATVSAKGEGEARARQELMRLAKQAENAVAVPVVIGYAPPPGARAQQVALAQKLRPWFRSILCTAGPLRVCVDGMDHRGDPDALRGAVRHAVRDALVRHRDLRASTQVGR